MKNTFWPGRCQTISILSQYTKQGKHHMNIHHASRLCTNDRNLQEDKDMPKSVELTLRCDGAHTIKSLQTCMHWFCNASGYNSDMDRHIFKNISANTNPMSTNHKTTKRILLFHCGHERNPVPMIDFILSIPRQYTNHHHEIQSTCTLPLFHDVYFCIPDSSRPSAVKEQSANELLLDAGFECNHVPTSLHTNENKGKVLWQTTLQQIWTILEKHHSPHKQAHTFTDVTVQEAMNHLCQGLYKDEYDVHDEDKRVDNVEICVTGSLYLVGSVLKAVGWEEESTICNLIS
eukprot:CAMPEP_0184871122 /NCGR_PEP_ID=MMETSP0580-20130426/40037_1 /TAXON_ID=1118495 /ORGANISM="Dactyliosolen fragilissimus" /LENGTH=288 /DNA_ID=CAMNT_0027373651 /DNA_START=49 /DNA_END=915 /DNA_ORIENTATION=+